MLPWIRQSAQVVMSTLLASMPAVGAISPNARPMIFEHLSTVDGLPQGTIFATLSDSRGFVWFATEDGLVRYDGHDIQRYAYTPSAGAGLPSSFVVALAEDRQSDLWLATKGGGLARWNRATDTFTSFRHDPTKPDSIASDSLWTLKIDTEGRVWVGTLDAGVDVVDAESGTATHLRHDAGNTASLINDRVFALMDDGHRAMWIGTDSGIDRWRLEGHRFVHLGLDVSTVLPGKQITAMTKTKDGSVWAATHESGLHHLSSAGVELETLKHDSPDGRSISDDQVHSLLDDGAGHLWVGTATGLDTIYLDSMHISHYVHDRAEPDSLSDSNIMSIYKDEAGLMWIGTRASGVNRWNSHSWELGGANPEWLDGKMVISFADAEDGHVWIGTLGGGLYNFDPATGTAINIDALLHKDDALGDRRIMSLRRDRHGDLWIGTWGKGLERLSGDGRLLVVGPAPGSPNGLSAPGVAAIYEARNGLLWIGTHGGGANIVDPDTAFVQQLPVEQSGGTSSKNVTAFMEDGVGNMWIATENGGLDVADARGYVLRSYKHDLTNPSSISSNIIYALEVDAKGDLWAATDGGGLDRVVGTSDDPGAVKFETFSRAEGLTSDTIYGVLRDAAGQLWLSGNSGLMRFNPASHEVNTYHREHGLQGEEFDSGAYFRTQDGRLCFGGPGGFNVFSPQSLAAAPKPPRIALTGVEVMGVPTDEGAPSWILQRVALDHRASVVSFDFAALDFTSPRRNRLAYRVSQLTDKWIDLNSSRRVSLTNLPAGDHVLEVRAANADSQWSTTPYRLIIHKAPPPWASLPAYILYVLFSLALVVWVIRAQRAKLRQALNAQQRLESVVALRTKELRETNQKLVVASEAKSNFLARMGHELRTPMNGVVGMTELIARSPLSPTQSRQLQTIRTSARTLLQILNDLLDLSKSQAGKTVLERLPLDLNSLVEECVSMFTGAAESKRIDIIVCPPQLGRLELLGDPLRIRQVLMNLVGNAVKFTEHGHVVVTCDVHPGDAERARVILSVADTGVGISPSARDRIFEPFTQADETTTRRFGGTGLGLSICKELLHLMGGELHVRSELGSGSTFTVTVDLSARPQILAVRPVETDATLLVVTERSELAESLRRRCALFAMPNRTVTLNAALVSDECDIVLIDADSHPSAASLFVGAGIGDRTIIVARPLTIEVQNLERHVDRRVLLRSPVQQDAFIDAISACVRQIGAGVGLERPAISTDVTGTFQFPLLPARVLVVEDDEVNGAVAEGYLAMLGCSNTWLKDGRSAVETCKTERFDIIFMDINMPGLDGYQTTQQIRALANVARTPIIALTANKASANRDECLTAGMDDILSKPYSLAELTGALRRWVDVTTLAPQQSAPPGSPKNLTHVDTERVVGGPAAAMSHTLFARIVSVFSSNAGDSLAIIDDRLRAHDWEAAQLAAHKLKGAAGNVGASVFAAQLADLEESCLKGDGATALHLNKLMRAALPALLHTLQQHSMRASA